MPPQCTPAELRLWPRVNKTETCWLWTAGLDAHGYGLFSDIRMTNLRGRAARAAHRWSYEHFVGPVPEGLDLDHLCRVRNCVRPDHLEPVTRRENLLRSPLTRTTINAAKTHCPQGHEYTPENTYLRPDDGSRQCCKCRKMRNDARGRVHREVSA